jgi:anthranilate synthase component 2
MVFVLDNYDSFTYNLVQYMGELGAEVVVRRNDELTPEEVEAMHPDRILLSPGPCTPEEAGISIALIRHFAKLAEEGGARVPILGVCLGHQAIGAAFGGRVVRAAKLMHGKTSEVEHDGRTIYTGIPSAMTCTRYHSLIVAEEGLPEALEVTARTVADGASAEAQAKKGRKAKAADENATGAGTGGTIMGLRHRTLPIEGVQFHPESVLTTHGKKIIANFLKM